MKMLCIALAVFISITAFFAVFGYCLKKDCTAILKEIEKTDQYFSSGNISEAKNSFSEAQKIWEDKVRYLQIHIEHNELDNINSLFASTMAALLHSEDEYYLLSPELKFYINHLYEKNRLNAETIF